MKAELASHKNIASIFMALGLVIVIAGTVDYIGHLKWDKGIVISVADDPNTTPYCIVKMISGNNTGKQVVIPGFYDPYNKLVVGEEIRISPKQYIKTVNRRLKVKSFQLSSDKPNFVFFGIGLGFVCLGLFLFRDYWGASIFLLRKGYGTGKLLDKDELVMEKMAAELADKGCFVDAQVVSVDIEKNTHILGIHPVRVKAQWFDKKSGKHHEFISQPIYLEKEEHPRKGASVKILVHPQNPEIYEFWKLDNLVTPHKS